MGGGRRARRCRRRGRWRRSWGVRPGRWRARTASCGALGVIAARDRARARVADGGSPRARWWLAGGRGCGWRAAMIRRWMRWCARRAKRSRWCPGRGAAFMAWRRWRADRPTLRCCICCMPSRGATTTPTSVTCWPGRPSCWCICGGARWGWSCRAATRWGCAGSPTWPAGAWRGGRGAAGRVCCWSGCWPRPASRRRRESGEPADSHFAVAAAVAAGAADAGLAVRAVARACDLDFVGVTVEPFELAVRAGRRRQRGRAARAAARPGLRRRRSPRSAATT